MALDGIVIRSLAEELRQGLLEGRIAKINQPESDELLLTINQNKTTRRLLISANASLPLCYFTESVKPNPVTAPAFCMLLRKHIGNGRILSVTQPGLERIIRIGIEHLDEMGDLRRKYLIIELMGKYSNIIFTDAEDTIIDSIKRVSSNVSSLREVLPGRPYFLPEALEKADPLTIGQEDFSEMICGRALSICKALYTGLTGISPMIAHEIAFRADLDGDSAVQSLSGQEKQRLWQVFSAMMCDVSAGHFHPNILMQGDQPKEFAALALISYGDCESRKYDSISHLLDDYYTKKNTLDRIRQRSSDLRRITQTALERTYKKLEVQERQLRDTEKRDQYRLWGELLNTYGYGLTGGEKSVELPNYYDEDRPVTIPLDETLSARENAGRFFDRYQKLKRTHEAVTLQLDDTRAELMQLESIKTALGIALYEEDLAEIKAELRDAGFIKKQAAGKKKEKITSKPFCFTSSDGFSIYVGKNNYQNEYITFTLADGGDWWFHAKGVPGSHVIVKTGGRQVPDRTLEEAAALAAYYSSVRDAAKVEVDYIRRKEVKKMPGGKPGFVVYHTNYSMMVKPGTIE